MWHIFSLRKNDLCYSLKGSVHEKNLEIANGIIEITGLKVGLKLENFDFSFVQYK
jgi:hypothetical protein